MVDRDLLAAKLSDLSDRIGRVREQRPASVEDLRESRDRLDLVSFNLMLCVQICADIASHIIADEGFAPTSSLSQGFTRLESHGVLTKETAEALRSAVGFRNVVAHGYSRVDVAMAYRAATEGLADLDAFAREVAAWANRAG